MQVWDFGIRAIRAFASSGLNACNRPAETIIFLNPNQAGELEPARPDFPHPLVPIQKFQLLNFPGSNIERLQLDVPTLLGSNLAYFYSVLSVRGSVSSLQSQDFLLMSSTGAACE